MSRRYSPAPTVERVSRPEQGELLVDVRVLLAGGLELGLEGALDGERLVGAAQVAQCPSDHPFRHPGAAGVADPLTCLEGLLEGGQGRIPLARVGVGHAEVVEQRGVPVAGRRLRRRTRGRQGRLGEPDLLLGRRGQRDHVQRVDVQRLQPGVPCGGRGGLEVRARGLGLAPRAQQPAALERDPRRHLGVVGGQVVEDGVTLVVPLLEAERAGHLGHQDQPVGALGRLCRGSEPLLGAGRVVEVPERGRVDHRDILSHAAQRRVVIRRRSSASRRSRAWSRSRREAMTAAR